MNMVDLLILCAIGTLALVGLKMGIIKPVTGIGGYIIGIALAGRYHGEAARLLSRLIDGPLLQTIAGYAVVFLAAAIIVKLIGTAIKRVLASLAIGWLDNTAGGLAGAAMGVVVMGTVMYLLGGASFAANGEAMRESRLAPQVARASLVSSSSPWCSSEQDSSGGSASCTELLGLMGAMTGIDVTADVSELLGGYDPETLVKLVKASLSGGDMAALVHLVKSSE